MQIVKLGGSVITDKKIYKTFRPEVTNRLAREIAESGTDVVIVHGAGSYGHIMAKKHRLNDGYIEDSQLDGVSVVQRDVRELNLHVMNALIDAGIKAVSIPPAVCVTMDSKDIFSLDYSRFEDYISMGLTPVTFGDVAVDNEIRFCICSGDLLVFHLARTLGAQRAIFVTDVDGIMSDTSGKRDIIPELKGINEFKDLDSVEIKKDDVTGKITGKALIMLELAQNGIEAVLLNGCEEWRLRSCLRGDGVLGTRASAVFQTESDMNEDD